jgi:hypothetical protein
VGVWVLLKFDANSKTAHIKLKLRHIYNDEARTSPAERESSTEALGRSEKNISESTFEQ